MLKYEPTDGDIVKDLPHPRATGMVCGNPRTRDGVTGVWVDGRKASGPQTWPGQAEHASERNDHF
jgi:hypothetical protein